MTNELYHHGILGQKWGVRRFQNKDGSLTAAGKKRQAKEYTKQLNELNDKLGKQYTDYSFTKFRYEDNKDALKELASMKKTAATKEDRDLANSLFKSHSEQDRILSKKVDKAFAELKKTDEEISAIKDLINKSSTYKLKAKDELPHTVIRDGAYVTYAGSKYKVSKRAFR